MADGTVLENSGSICGELQTRAASAAAGAKKIYGEKGSVYGEKVDFMAGNLILWRKSPVSLAANIPLNRLNLAPLSFVDVPQDLYIQGLLGVYELLDVSLLRDVFGWAYERSCLRYPALRQTLGEPDRFRVHYREEIKTLVTRVVTNALSQEDAGKFVESGAARVPESDRARFVEVVETELLGLHPGNIARFRIRPAEFAAWKAVWDKPKTAQYHPVH